MYSEQRLVELEMNVGSQPYIVVLNLVDEIRRLRKAVAEENDACAKLAESLPWLDHEMDDGRTARIAAAIRSRIAQPTPKG